MLQARPARAEPPRAQSRDELRRLPLRRDKLAVDQAFGDLNCVERRALAQIVRYDPHRQAIIDGRVLANAAYKGRVLTGRFVGRHVAAELAGIDYQATWRIAEDLSRFVGRNRL